MMVKKWLTTKTIKQDHEKRFDKEKKTKQKPKSLDNLVSLSLKTTRKYSCNFISQTMKGFLRKLFGII